MLDRRLYKRCNLQGEGTIRNLKNGGAHFELVNISASGALIKTKENLYETQIIDIVIDFSGHMVEAVLYCKGLIVRKEHVNSENLFGVKFMHLDDKERTEIDELIAFSCNTGHIVTGIDSCDEGHCKYIK